MDSQLFWPDIRVSHLRLTQGRLQNCSGNHRLGSDSKNAKSLCLGWCVTQQKLTDTPSMAEFISILSLCSVAKSCPTLCDPMCCAPLGSLVYGILQARRQEWAAISSSRVSSWPREWTRVSWLAGRFFTLSYQESPYPYKGLYTFLPQYLCPIWGHLLCWRSLKWMHMGCSGITLLQARVKYLLRDLNLHR